MKRLGSLLTELGWITSEQLEHALQMQELLGGRLGTNLLDLGAISEQRLQTMLAHQLGIPAARARDLRAIPHEVHGLLPGRLAEDWKAVPFRMLGRELHVALMGVDDVEVLHRLALATSKEIRPFVVNEARLLCSLDDHFQLGAPPRIRALTARLDGAESDSAACASGTLWPSRPRARSAIRAAQNSPLVAGLARLDRLDDRDRIARTLLDVLMPRFRRVVLLKLARGCALGWRGAGPGVDTSALRRLRIDLGQPSVLHNLARGASHHLGTLPPMPAHEELASAWGGGLPGDCVVLPVNVRGRLVCAVFCEPGLRGVPEAERSMSVAELTALSEAAGRAFERCIRRQRELPRGEAGSESYRSIEKRSLRARHGAGRPSPPLVR